MRRRSIARRLILSVLAVQLLSALSVIGATAAYERHVHFRAFDVMLRGRADSMLGAVQEASDASDDVVLDRNGLRIPPEDVYEVEENDGRVLGRSENWGGSAGLQRSSPGEIFRTTIHGRRYRVIRLEGSRTVDPGESGGGTVHRITIFYGATTVEVWRAIRQAVIFYAAASCVLLALTGSLVFWVLRRGLLPLRELALEAERLSVERWSFSPPESARSTEELIPLVTALESAVRRLERSFGQQARFVSDAAHELKTAVAVVKSSLQVMTMRPRSAPEYEAGLERSLGDLERMERIVGEMLTLARVEHRTDTPGADEAVDLREVVSAAAQQFAPMAEMRRVTLSVEAPQPLSAKLGREDALLLLSNLVINALQHSAEGGVVKIAICRRDPALVELLVSDDGEGIAADVLPHVFERFYRGDPSRVRKTGGTGLGLAICRAIVERAGGAIAMESTPGVGTRAVVRLPQDGPNDTPAPPSRDAGLRFFSVG